MSTKTLRITWILLRRRRICGNTRKHSVSFEEARDVFNDPFFAAESDDLRSDDEDRHIGYGVTGEGNVLFVCYTIQGEDEETMRFDWSKAVRGLHYIPREKRPVTLDEDVSGIFCTSDEVNNALRLLIKEGRIPHFLSDEEWYAKHPKKSRHD
jgi:uncharacterized DUF497 family protein